MKRYILAVLLGLFALFAVPSAPAQNATVSGDLSTIFHEQLQGDAFVRVRLRNFSGCVPRISGGGGIIAETTKEVSPDATGHFSTTLVRNDFVDICGVTSRTFYSVEYWNNGIAKSTANYQCNSATCDLNTLATFNPQPPPLNILNAVLTNPNGTQVVAQPAGTELTVSALNSVRHVPPFSTIQAAVTDAGTTGTVEIEKSYAGTDVCTTACNPNGIQIVDLRGKPDRYRGFINMLTDCGLKGDGTTDDAPAAQACFTAYPSRWFVFPQTQLGGACSYWFASTVFTHGEGMRVSGASAGFKNSNTTLGGTVICAAAGVTPFWSDMTPNSTSGTTFENFSIKGAEGHDHLQTPTKLNIPSGANLPQYTRNISAAQRTGGNLAVTITAVGNEALAQQVGSTVKISGTSDATVNGECIIATLTGLNSFNENATGFTCPQNGADTGALGAGGTVSLPTTGTSTADGIRICSNFNTIFNVTIDSMGRHAVNADSTAGHGCTTAFSDDLVIENSNFVGNQGSGFLAQGIDSNAGTMTGNTMYYSVLWGIEDESSLGNTWVGNQISNNGVLWATTSTPATKNITSISRTLGTADSIVSVVLALADTNIKVGSCVVIAGVTDGTFNSAAGQCFFVTTRTDSTHYTYIQPGAPANASSSGGTSRMAKFSEAYLSAGIDSGAIKAGLQSQVQSQPWLGNYVEGGQACKFGSNLIVIGGANIPVCVSLNTFKPTGILGTTPGIVSSTLQVGGFANEKDQNFNVNFKAGKSGSTVRNICLRFWNNNTTLDGWGMQVDPSGTNGSTGSWLFGSSTCGATTRLQFFGSASANGLTRLASESTGAVEINNFNGAGSGGTKFGSGGVTNSTVATIDATGLGTFNGGVKVAPAATALTSTQGSTGTKAFACTGSFTNGNLVKTDSNGNCVDAGGPLAYTFSSANKRWELFDSTIPTWLVDAQPALKFDVSFPLFESIGTGGSIVGGGIKWSLAGTGTPSGSAATDAYKLNTSNVSGDSSNIVPQGSLFQTQNLQSFWLTFLTPSTASIDARAGFVSLDAFMFSGAAPTDGIYLEALNADTNWFLVTMNTSVQTRCDTTVAKSTSAQSFVITVTTGSVSAFVPGTAGAKCTNATNIPAAATTLSPSFGVKTQTAGVKVFHLYHFTAIGKQAGY